MDIYQYYSTVDHTDSVIDLVGVLSHCRIGVWVYMIKFKSNKYSMQYNLGVRIKCVST